VLLDFRREKSAAQRAVRHEADAQFAAERQNFRFHVARPQGVFGLQRGDGMHFGGAAEGGGRRLGKAQPANFAGADQLTHRADGFLDGHLRIHAVLVVEVNDLDGEALQAGVAALADVFGPAIDAEKLPPAHRAHCRTWSPA